MCYHQAKKKLWKRPKGNYLTLLSRHNTLFCCVPRKKFVIIHNWIQIYEAYEDEKRWILMLSSESSWKTLNNVAGYLNKLQSWDSCLSFFDVTLTAEQIIRSTSWSVLVYSYKKLRLKCSIIYISGENKQMLRKGFVYCVHRTRKKFNF